jgi:hypothetical protein
MFFPSGEKMKILYIMAAMCLILSGCSSVQTGQSLFDGQKLGNWTVTKFFRHGDVYVSNGCIIIEKGNGFLTGVTWDGLVERMNYQISLEAKRIEGDDFFCGLTFPVDANCCSLILSGWRGDVSGISCIDGYDASENETTRKIQFENNRWYKIVVRVIPGKILAWVDGREIVNVNTTGKKINVRSEVELSQPLGIAAYNSTGVIRNIRIKELK